MTKRNPAEYLVAAVLFVPVFIFRAVADGFRLACHWVDRFF